jgi:flagellar protein FliS
MMHRPDPGQSYLRIATQTASPGQLILMLFDGALRFLERAKLGFANDDPLEFHQTIHNNITRAQAIISELNASLNLEQGGEFAATMRRLYDYMDTRLHESNLHKKEDGIIEVVKRLAVIREAWAQMLQQNGTEAGAPAQVSLSVMG